MKSASVEHVLRSVSRRYRTVEVTASILRWAAIGLLSILVITLLDAAVGLKTWALLLALFLLGVVGGVACWRVCSAWQRTAHDPVRAAAWIERASPVPMNRLIHAVQLAVVPTGSPALCRAAVDAGHLVTADIDVSGAVSSTPLKHAAWTLVGSVTAMLLVQLLWPGLLMTGWQRYTQPLAGHAPFTDAQLRVEVSPEPMVFQRPVTVRLVVEGADPPTRADIRVEGADASVWPMRLMEQREKVSIFQFTWEPSAASVRYRLETPRGRTGWLSLELIEPATSTQRASSVVGPIEPAEGSVDQQDEIWDSVETAAALHELNEALIGEISEPDLQGALDRAIKTLAGEVPIRYSGLASALRETLLELEASPLSSSDPSEARQRALELAAALIDTLPRGDAVGEGAGSPDAESGRVTQGEATPHPIEPLIAIEGQTVERLQAEPGAIPFDTATGRRDVSPAYRTMIEAYFYRLATEQP